MEVLNSIWNYVLPIGGGVTIGAVLIAIGSIVIKSVTEKVLKKVDIEKIETKAVEKGVEKVKAYTFKHNIQPLVNSELEKVVEVVDRKVDAKLDKVDKRYGDLILCIEKLANYFDNSIGVSEEKKAELKKAIENAKIDDISLETVAVEEIPSEILNTAQNGSNALKKGNTVVR